MNSIQVKAHTNKG